MSQALAGTKVNHYHGIDLSQPALELAAKNLKGVPFAGRARSSRFRHGS
jgi:hypothetical protein